MNETKTAQNLKYLRKKRGLRQQQMRDVFGITRSSWSNYENGVTTPSLIDLINFSRYFGITLDELILQNLEARDPLPVKILKKPQPRTVVYAFNEATTATGEPDILYVLNELKRLREEISSIRKE